MGKVLFAILSFASCSVCAAATPELFSRIVTQSSFLQGTERFYPVDMQKGWVKAASAEGGVWVTTPDGEHVFAKTVRVEGQRDGNQTWVGEVSTPGGERSVIITFGKDATFGSLLSAAATVCAALISPRN